MYQSGSFKCDICGKEHTPTNGWYLVRFSTKPAGLVITVWNEKDAKRERKHICGEGCLHTYLSRNLDSIKSIEQKEKNEEMG